MAKQKLLLVAIGFFVVIGVALLFYITNTTTLKLSVENISSYQVKDGERIIHSSVDKDSSIRLQKNSRYTIHFEGIRNYESSQRTVEIGTEPKSVTIKPYYSKEYLRQLLAESEPILKEVINSYDTAIANNYSVSNVTMYHYGNWASADLIWRGEYGENTDTLTIILNKENDEWVVAGSPSIIFFSGNNPKIPIDILRSVNSD